MKVDADRLKKVLGLARMSFHDVNHPIAITDVPLQEDIPTAGAGSRQVVVDNFSFAPVMAALREALSMLIDSKATPIPIVEKAYGVHVAMLADKTLLDNASFILVVRADVPGETLRARFGQQSKVGSVEHIRDLVNLQLPGISLLPLPVAPRQLPYHAGSTYYELDRGSEHWQQLGNSGGFAFHIAGQFPGLNLAFWAIRG